MLTGQPDWFEILDAFCVEHGIERPNWRASSGQFMAMTFGVLAELVRQNAKPRQIENKPQEDDVPTRPER